MAGLSESDRNTLGKIVTTCLSRIDGSPTDSEVKSVRSILRDYRSKEIDAVFILNLDVSLRLRNIKKDPAALRPDAWLLWGSGRRSTAVLLEAKTRGEQYLPQLVWYRDSLLGGGAYICPTKSWADVVRCLRLASQGNASDQLGAFLVQEFATYLDLSPFPGEVLEEVEVEVLQEGWKGVQFYRDQVRPILEKARESILADLKPWNLKKDGVNDTQTRRGDNAFQQFYLNPDPKGRYFIGVFSSPSKWVESKGTLFWIIVCTKNQKVTEYLEQGEDWEHLAKDSDGTYWLSPVPYPAGDSIVRVESLVSSILQVLKKRLGSIRKRLAD